MAERLVVPRKAAVTRWRGGSVWFALACVPALLLFVLPLVALVLRLRPERLFANLQQASVAQAVVLSLGTSATTVVLGVICGTPIAYVLGRRRFPGKRLLDTLIDLPTVMPPSVAGIALLIAFGRRGLFGQFFDDIGVTISFTSIAVVIAQMFVAVPLYIKTAAAGFAEIDRELELAAAVDGATKAAVFRHVTLPLARTTLLTGAVLTWARSLGEFGATIIFAGNFPGRTQTMPLAIYIGFELDFDVALTLAAILLAISFGVLWVVKAVFQQKAVG